MSVQSFVRLAASTVFAGVLLPLAVAATPATYTFTGGTVDITGTAGATTLFADVGVSLTGDSIVFDAAGLSVDSVSISGGPSGLITMSSTYGGFDGFTLDDFTLSGSAFTTNTVTGGPNNFAFTIGPLGVTADATGYIGGVPAGSIPTYTGNAGTLSGTLDVNTGELIMNGVTLLVVTGFDPTPLVVKGDFIFTGMVPEPSLAMLLAAGLAVIATKTRIRS